jgi:hypothetical protein
MGGNEKVTNEDNQMLIRPFLKRKLKRPSSKWRRTKRRDLIIFLLNFIRHARGLSKKILLKCFMTFIKANLMSVELTMGL